jgi:CheY-like chemotaxis protein
MISALYVDDEPALLEIGRIFLERTGDIRVDTAESAPVALKMLQSATYDVVISDYQMPVMDGVAFLKEIRKENALLPFIIFTGKGREDVVIEALNCGADHYIQKGGAPKAQFAELTHTIRRAVERKRANDTILHLNRIYSVLSRTNKAVIHIRTRRELLDEACRIAVEEGKFLMAWIGMADPATHQVQPVAACGYEEGYLSNLSITTDNVPQGMGLTGSAIREGRPMICNDIRSDPRMEQYRDKAARRGYRSSAALPIRNGDLVVGAMRFYACERGFFNDREMELLQELVEDISFALGLMKGNSGGQMPEIP